MIRTYSDNAVLAKVRALYGKRLTENDYTQLMGKKTVGEVAAYLKKETYYSELLQEVKEDLIHREQLENFVHRRTLNTYVRLMKYSLGESLFLTLYVMENEIDQILMAIRLLNSGSIDRYIITLPVYLARLMSFDLFAVAKIRTFDDLLAILEHSEYYHIIGKFRPASSAKLIDITLCETAMLEYYYRRALEISAAQYKGDTREDLESLFHFRASIHNISVIFRMRRYLNSKADMIRPRIVSVEGDRSSRLYEQMLEAPTLHDMQVVLESHRRLRRHSLNWEQDSLGAVSRVYAARRDVNRKLFRFSSKPAVVVICYMALLDIEVNNITNIIEGIRYGLPPAEIRSLLAI